MDRFRKSLSESLITRFISYCLITQLIFPPLWVNNVYAALVTDPHAAVSFRPQIDNTYNIPVINIVAPNNTGLSHNKYQDFDVDLNGLVFNNSLVTGNSRLAGSIVANPLFDVTVTISDIGTYLPFGVRSIVRSIKSALNSSFGI